MPITNNWDSTFPPDTQLANLLGSDLRNFRLDTQQRMAAISGTLANRWNPGADIQPTNWTGLLYFTTDTNQVFQWSGAAWVDVTSQIGSGRVKVEGTNVIPVTISNTNALTPLQAITIPANDIGVGQTFYVDVIGIAQSTASPTLTLGLYLDGVLLGSCTPLTGSRNLAANTPWGIRTYFMGVTIGAAGTVTACLCVYTDGTGFGYISPNFSPNGTVVIDTTSSHSLRLQAQWGVANASNTITSNAMTCYRVG